MDNLLGKRNKNLISAVFARMLLPALIAGASANLAGMIDGIIVGNTIGSNALAAVNACRPAMQVYGFFSEILVSGMANCIARCIGRNEKENANRMFTTGVLTAAIAGVILLLSQLIFAKDICWMLTGDETIYPLALEYYSVFIYCVFFILICEPMTSAMRTDGYPVMSGIVLLLPPLLNAGLDVVFIKVFNMGLTGAATATVLSYVMGFLLCCYYFFFKRSYRLVSGDYGKNLAEITSVGIPPSMNIGLISIKLLIVNRLALSEGGANGLAIMSVLMVAWALESLFIGGVKQTMMPMISFYYASGDYHGVRAVFKHALKILMISEGILCLILEVFPKLFPLLFGMRDPLLLDSAAVAIRIFGIYLLMEAFIMLTITYYTSVGKKKFTILLSVLQGLVATIIVIYPLVNNFGITGVWISFPIASIIPLVVIAVVSKGSVDGFFKMRGHTYLQEFSIDINKLSRTVETVINAVCDAGFEKSIANRMGVAIEEMTVDAFNRNNSKKLHVDVTVRKIDDALLVTFTDDGVEFDPVQAIDEEAKENPSNLAVLQAISHKMEYGRVVGMNKTDITILESVHSD